MLELEQVEWELLWRAVMLVVASLGGGGEADEGEAGDKGMVSGFGCDDDDDDGGDDERCGWVSCSWA